MYEYSGYTYQKRKQDVRNQLKYQKGVKTSDILEIQFNKKKSKHGWKWRAKVRR